MAEAAERMSSEPASFTERVMTAIAVAPIPTPTRTFLAAIRAGAARDACAALSVAWHITTVRAWYIAPSVRTRSLALILGVVTLLGMASLVAAAATVQVVSPQWLERAQVADPVAPVNDEPAPAFDLPTRGGGDGQADDPAEGPAKVDPPDKTDEAAGDSTDDGSDLDDRHAGDQLDDGDERLDGASGDSDPPDKIDSSHDGSSHDGSSGDSDRPNKIDTGHDGSNDGADPPDKVDDGHPGDPQDEPDESRDSGDGDDDGGSGG